jgi:Prenyltransferase and squalene oxidase repeat
VKTAPLPFLLDMQNPDGGWPSQPGRSSNTEATAYALLALRAVAAGDRTRAGERGLRWLSDRRRPDGSWAFSAPVPEASWATGIATLTMLGEDRDRARSSVSWLLGQQGRSLGWHHSLLYRVAPSLLLVRLNPDLKGWPWRLHATGFVEPTAYSLIALKKLRPHTDTRAEARIQEAEAMLYDRMCPNGGWNYGNSVVLGVDLPPYADVTALTLIALQDYRGSEPNVVSLAALRRMLAEVHSSLALAWGTLCLSLYGENTESLRWRLAQRYRQRPYLVDSRSLALSLLALAESTVFRL